LEAGEGRLAVEKWRPCVRIIGTSFDACLQIVFLALLSVCPLTTPAPVTAQETAAQEVLTNDSIVRMVKAGLSENVILEMINPGESWPMDGLCRRHSESSAAGDEAIIEKTP
jgi:hypothetical protein